MRFKIDILHALKSAGYSTYRIRKDNLLAEGVLQSLRAGAPISWENIGRLCGLLNCQPGDILEYVAEEKTGE